jgi:hypothetical protein
MRAQELTDWFARRHAECRVEPSFATCYSVPVGELLSARNQPLGLALPHMDILILLVVVFAAGLIGLVSLVVLETDLCPHWARRLLQKHRQPLSESEKQTKDQLRKSHSRRLKKLEAR